MESLSIEKSRKAKLGIRSHFLSLLSEWSQNLGKTEFSGTCLRRSSDLISRQELGAWQIGLISLRSKYVLCTYTVYTQTNQLRTALRLNLRWQCKILVIVTPQKVDNLAPNQKSPHGRLRGPMRTEGGWGRLRRLRGAEGGWECLELRRQVGYIRTLDKWGYITNI